MTTRPSIAAATRGNTKPHDAPKTLLGRVLDGRYRLDEVLTSGGMGIVFRATQLSVRRPIAVKILRPTLADRQELVQRFTQEIRVVSSLQHPNIVALIDAGRDAGGLTYLAMEFFEGVTFRQALKSGELSLPDILDVLVQTCDALIEAHAAEVIHRDLKLDNIMMARQRDGLLHVKILDFGVAKILSSNLHLTRSGQVPGTPGIIAPELIDELPPSPASDLYSLGVLLYTALCGEAPFAGNNDLELMRAHKFDPVPALESRVNAAVPAELVALVMRLLEKEPQARPQSAREVRDRLDQTAAELRRRGLTLPYNPAPDADIADPTFEEASPQQARRDNAPFFDMDERAEELLASDGEKRFNQWRQERERRAEKDPLERFVRAFFGETPVVAPTTVVVLLSILLLALVLTIFYLLLNGYVG